MKTIKAILGLAALVASAAGCATASAKQEPNAAPRVGSTQTTKLLGSEYSYKVISKDGKICTRNVSNDGSFSDKCRDAKIYSSPVVKAEYGLKDIEEVNGNVDETHSLYVDGKDLYVVGFSNVFPYEQTASKDAVENARNTASGMTIQPVSPVRYETRQVIDKNGKVGYVVEVLCKAPLDKTKQIQGNLEEVVVSEKVAFNTTTRTTTSPSGNNNSTKQDNWRYKLTNISEPIMIELERGLDFAGQKALYEMADVGFDGKKLTGKADNKITGAEAKALYIFIKANGG